MAETFDPLSTILAIQSPLSLDEFRMGEFYSHGGRTLPLVVGDDMRKPWRKSGLALPGSVNSIMQSRKRALAPVGIWTIGDPNPACIESSSALIETIQSLCHQDIAVSSEKDNALAAGFVPK